MYTHLGLMNTQLGLMTAMCTSSCGYVQLVVVYTMYTHLDLGLMSYLGMAKAKGIGKDTLTLTLALTLTQPNPNPNPNVVIPIVLPYYSK